MKSIQLSRISKEFIDELRNEIEILRNLDHPNIVKAYEVFDNSHQIYIIMELCSGGDLYAKKPYSEKEAAKIVGKLLSALKHMHAKGIIHRDLKFENIMFENTKPDAEIKLIDFGLSAKFSETNPYLYEGVGTICKNALAFVLLDMAYFRPDLPIATSTDPFLPIYLSIYLSLYRHYGTSGTSRCLHIPSRSVVGGRNCLYPLIWY